MDTNECDESMNGGASTTVVDALPEEPIKISIYTSDDGQYHMKYDDYAVTNGAERSKSKRKSNSNKSLAMVKPTTETLYEIDLYCDVCNHDYKSLMSLNRHMRTRKHLNQLAKLNEANEQSAIGRDWSNYDNYLSSTYDLMPHNVYNSIVQTLLDDDVVGAATNAIITDTTNVLTEPHNVNESGNNFQTTTYDSYENWNNNDCATMNNNVFRDIHEAMDATANDETYDENQTIVDIIQRSMCNSYKCLICGELFPSAQLLQEHTHQMRENCGAKIDGDEFDLETELQKLELPPTLNTNC